MKIFMTSFSVTQFDNVTKMTS